MTLYLVRHANAGRRSPTVKDIDRSLDDTGHGQASRLRELLAPLAPMQVLSSPALRCQQTVAPLADTLGVSVDVSQDLWEGQPESLMLSLLRRLAAAAVSAVLCSHGDTIPRVIDAIADSGIPVAGTGCAKGSVWTLTVTDGAITDAKYTPSP